MPFALGAPFSVENSSADLLHFPSWRAILLNAIGQRRFTTKASAIVGTGLGHVVGVVAAREPENGADPHRRRLGTILHVPKLSRTLCRNPGYPLQIM
jgi:hypothetical protein